MCVREGHVVCGGCPAPGGCRCRSQSRPRPRCCHPSSSSPSSPSPSPPSHLPPPSSASPARLAPPQCDIPLGCCFFTGPWTVTRSSLRVPRRVAAFCRPLRPVLLLVSFPRSRSPVIGVPGLRWMWHGVPFAPGYLSCLAGPLLLVCCARPCPSWCGSRVLCVCVAPPPVCWRSWVPLLRPHSCATRLPPRTRISRLCMTLTVPRTVGWSRPCCHPRGGQRRQQDPVAGCASVKISVSQRRCSGCALWGREERFISSQNNAGKCRDMGTAHTTRTAHPQRIKPRAHIRPANDGHERCHSAQWGAPATLQHTIPLRCQSGPTTTDPLTEEHRGLCLHKPLVPLIP